MSRNKQRDGNLNHSEYTIIDGHGGMKRNMGAGAKIKPKDTKAGIDAKGALEANKGKKDEAPQHKPEVDTSDMEGKGGWDKIGQAGADMVGEYQKRKKASAE